jgi:hypothetical protein
MPTTPLAYRLRILPDAGASASSKDLDYANQAAAEADGATVTDTASAGAFTFASGHAIPGSGLSESILFDAGDGTGHLRIEYTFTVTSGEQYTAKVWCEPVPGTGWWAPASLTVTSGANSASDDVNGNEPRQR